MTPVALDSGPTSWARVDLGPALPMPVFTSSEVYNPERIGALAIYCSDGRWGEAFDEFCHKRLLIPRYDRWVLPGGPVCLLPREQSRDYYQANREQLDFLVRVHELTRIVLIAHYGCAFYAELLKRGAEECLPTQTDDLRAAATTLRDWFPEVNVECYVAMRREQRLSFHWLEG